MRTLNEKPIMERGVTMKTSLHSSQKLWFLPVLVCMTAVLCYGVDNQILSVSPDSAYQGQTALTVTFTLDMDMPPAPPAGVMPDSVSIGGIAGSSITHDSQYTITAVFDIPGGESAGTQNVTITFATPQGELNFILSGGFTIMEPVDMPPHITGQPQSQTAASGSPVTFMVSAWGTNPLSYQWYKDNASISGANDASYTIDSAAQSSEGDYLCLITNDFGSVISDTVSLTIITDPPYDGYNLFASLTSTETYLMDNDGGIVKTWTSSYRPGLCAYFLEDGTLLRTANTNDTTFNVGGAGGRIEQYDWDGNLIWSYDYSTSAHRQHHDIERLPNGNILMIAWELKSQAEAVAAGRDGSLLTDGELWPDTIIEVQPDGTTGGSIVWQWHVWDHLIQDYDSTKANYGVVADHPEKINLNYVLNGQADWTHINSVDYNAQLDQILVSVHNFSEVWVINHNTTTAQAAGSGGDLLYRWGNPQAYDRGSSSDQQVFSQHDAEWIESGLPGEGDILIFNNGLGRTGGNYSSVDQIMPPVNPDGSYTLLSGWAYGPQTPAWTYTSTPVTDFYAERISGAQRLANGDTLICEGTTGRMFEVTSDGTIVWEYDYDGEVFRVLRYSPSYAGFIGTELEPEPLPESGYPIVDTGQVKCYNDGVEITAPAAGEVFYGQDAQYNGNQPSYTLGNDGLTVTDNVTGLTWTQTADINGDGVININDKLTYAEALVYPDTLNAVHYGGYNDWRLPSIKELYSLMNFAGEDPSSFQGTDTSGLVPFINTDYFGFNYGDTTASERIIDAQWASSTRYVSTTMGGNETVFGLNLADGRIKGYPTSKLFYVYFVRGNTNYGINNFVENGDGTISDKATGLMWSQDDCGAINGSGPRSGMNWQEALAWIQTKNAENYLGYSDWRLPNAKEMQSILDYTRSPDTTDSAAIDPVFNATRITNEGGQADYPWYWTSTTHVADGGSGQTGAYVCFGRALGYWQSQWEDVHGAGCQRSDQKIGDLSIMSGFVYVADGYYFNLAPQGDAARIDNYVRLVRDTQCGNPGFVSTLAGDLNADCYVNMLDIAQLGQGWLTAYQTTDLLIVAENWLNCIDPDTPCDYLP
jgi:hypothetical protein